MKSKIIKTRKKFSWKWINFFSPIIKKVRNRQEISGENLIEEPGKNPSRRIVLVVFASIVIFGLLWVAMRYVLATMSAFKMYGQKLFTGGVDTSMLFENAFNFEIIRIPWNVLLLMVLGAIILGYISTRKLGYSMKSVAFGQKGDSRLATIKEIEEQYPKIPDHHDTFKGYGGIPVSHYKSSYYIDTDTVHNIVIGTSRSGKGQTEVLPMLDILSRAEKQSSLVINDPKGELYNASVDTLKKRGYDVYLLNMADGSQSMSYNPLSLIVKTWLQGDVEGGMQLVNTLTYTLYHDDKAGQNAWVYEGAQKAVNGMIIALIEYCVDNDMVDKITLNNVIDMLNELGTVEYTKDPNNAFDKSNLLDEFFKSLPQGNIAKREFGSTSFSGDKAKGSIYSTIIQKLSVFSMPKNARMTSMNTLDFKTVGFPKYMSFKMPAKFYNKRIKMIFIDDNGEQKGNYTIKVGFGGFVEYNFADSLKTGDKVLIRYIDEESGKRSSSSFELDMGKDDPHHVVDLKPISNKLHLENTKFVYSDKPTAIFMKIPDFDSSNNDLASIFVSQLYSELAKQCSYVAGGKTIKRVHFLLDEFGNMIPIKDMDQIMTVSAGRNILFSLFLQSYAQLFNAYGKENGQTIKENGQNQVLIKTTDKDTINEFSDGAGKKTIENGNVNKSMLNINQSMNVNADSMPLLPNERLISMLEGEMLVLRPLHRQDLKHRRIRPFPIFNTKQTIMPYAYTFLTDDFDPSNDPNMLDIYSPHADLDLKSLSIDFHDFVTFDAKAEAAYKKEHPMSNMQESDNTAEDNDFGDTDQNTYSNTISSPQINPRTTYRVKTDESDSKTKSEFIDKVQSFEHDGKLNSVQSRNLQDGYSKGDTKQIMSVLSNLPESPMQRTLLKVFNESK